MRLPGTHAIFAPMKEDRMRTGKLKFGIYTVLLEKSSRAHGPERLARVETVSVVSRGTLRGNYLVRFPVQILSAEFFSAIISLLNGGGFGAH